LADCKIWVEKLSFNGDINRNMFLEEILIFSMLVVPDHRCVCVFYSKKSDKEFAICHSQEMNNEVSKETFITQNVLKIKNTLSLLDKPSKEKKIHMLYFCFASLFGHLATLNLLFCRAIYLL